MMASSTTTTNTTVISSDDISSTSSSAEISCPICLQEFNHPIKLPCSHIFCFLCAKGAALQTSKCPMCRGAVPHTFFLNPTIVPHDSNNATATTVVSNVPTVDGDYHWYYEGRNGWWLYDERASLEIENEFQQKSNVCEILIAGFIYVIDFQNMVQYRKDAPQMKKRKIKRDKSATRTKGIAGLKVRLH